MKKISMLGKSWSFSKYLAFENCPKALWFEERSKPHTRNLIPLYSLIGTSVHKAISFFVGNWSKNVVVSPKEVKKTDIAFIRDVWKNRNQTITEFFNGTEMNESLGSKFESSFSTLIDNFFLYIWPTFVNEEYVTHERLFTLSLKDYKILVKPDLVTRDEAGNLLITDWKTSTTHDDSIESFQVSTYGLWATYHYNLDPERVILQVINLRTGRKIRDKFSHEKEGGTLNMIKSQIEELNHFSQEEIPLAKPEPNKCKRCLHLKICEDGNRIIIET